MNTTMRNDSEIKKNKEAAWHVAKMLLVMTIVMGTAGFIVPPLYKLIMGKANDTNCMIIASALYSVALLLIFVKKRWCVLTMQYINTKPWGTLAWAALVALGSLIPLSVVEELTPKLPDLIGDQMMEIVNNDFGYFTICLFAPLIEEMIMRGAVLRTLLGSMRSRWGAIAVSALLFALIHMNPAQMPTAFLAGLFLGWIYSKTGSILPGVVYHWMNNTAAFVFCRMMPQYADSSISQVFGGNHRTLILAVIFSLFILLPSIYQLNRVKGQAQ